MIRDITLGQYYPAKSVIHRLDPRIKLTGTLAYIIGLFILDNFWGLLMAGVFLASVIKLSHVPLSYIVRGLKPILIIIIFTFILNMLMLDGEPLFTFWKFTVTKEGLYKALFMAARLVLLILGSSILTFATKPISLTDGMEAQMKPFERFGLPAHELAMMMTIALRFIPTLLEETDKIMKAQQARGADFESGNIFKRAKNMIPILVPLFIGAFRIAQEMAMAMEARCYRGGAGRTRMNVMKYEKCDFAAAVLILIFVGGCIVCRILL